MKIRTDFVTNSSSSSFVVEINIEMIDNKTISFESYSDCGESLTPYGSVFVSLSPKKLGEAASIEKLLDILEQGVEAVGGIPYKKNIMIKIVPFEEFVVLFNLHDFDENDYEDWIYEWLEYDWNFEDYEEMFGKEPVDIEKEEFEKAVEIIKGRFEEEFFYRGEMNTFSAFSMENCSNSAQKFIDEIKNIKNVNDIRSIQIKGQENHGVSDVDYLNVKYDCRTKKYWGQRYGHEIEEYPNGGCGGGFSIPDSDDCELEEAFSIDGKTYCETCGKEVDPSKGFYQRHKEYGLFRFCSPECFSEYKYMWDDEEEAWESVSYISDNYVSETNETEILSGEKQETETEDNKLPTVLRFEGDYSLPVWKHPVERIVMSSILIVPESMEAVFVVGGKIADRFGGGKYIIEADSLPELSYLSGDLSGKMSFPAELYFIKEGCLDVLRQMI